MPTYKKLVRDKIPEIISSSGKKANCCVLGKDEYIVELKRKLDEECAEYQCAKNIEELMLLPKQEGIPFLIWSRFGQKNPIKEAQRNILSNPFKRFEDMQMLRHTETLGIIEVEPTVCRNLSTLEKEEISTICDKKLDKYYKRFAE